MKRFELLAEMGCIVCLNHGLGASPAEIHHLKGTGWSSMGKKSSDRHTIPLCPIHHRTGGGGHVGYHQSPAEFERRYGTQMDLLERVDRRLDQ